MDSESESESGMTSGGESNDLESFVNDISEEILDMDLEGSDTDDQQEGQHHGPWIRLMDPGDFQPRILVDFGGRTGPVNPPR